MDDSAKINTLFESLTATIDIEIDSVENRILQAATDERLVVAVLDECSAQIDALFPYGGESTEEYEKRHDDAKARLMGVAANVQHEFGLDDESILRALDIARRGVQRNKTIFD